MRIELGGRQQQDSLVCRKAIRLLLNVGLLVFLTLVLTSQPAHAWPGDLFVAWSSPEMDDTRSVDWGDWDGDGDLDLAVGNSGQPNRVYENDGGSLILVWSSTETDSTNCVDWGDWDADGDLDLAVGNFDSYTPQPNRVYENIGGSLSLAWSSAEVDDTRSVAWGDWDGDGDLDLAVGNTGGYPGQPNRVYENDGGTLTLAWSSTETDSTESVDWGDWDGDGDLDLAVGNSGANRVYENIGGSLTLAWTSTGWGSTNSVDWGDWDGDGDLDLAVGNGFEANQVYENTGGSLSLAWSSPEIGLITQSVTWGDWDGDGDLDLAVGNWDDTSNRVHEPNQVYENVGGSLSLAWSSAETDETRSVAWGDWDGDGDLDLAVGNWSDEPNRVYENGGGSLSLAWSSPGTQWTTSVAWGDWDGDGDLDLAVGNRFGPNRVYEKSGDSLSLAWSSAETDDTWSVAWGDWDGDGDLDLAAGNGSYAAPEPSRVYENVGGSLSLAWSSPESGSAGSVAWGDWDGDGDLDFAVGNRHEPNRVYENIGGSLSLAWSSPDIDIITQSVAWGDWDGDGDLDLAVGTSDGQPNRVYENVGGSLSLAWSSPETNDTYSVAWGDWDGDGDLDLAVGNSYQRNQVYEKSGDSLSLAWSSSESDDTTSVAWGDWDGDGDLDLAVGNAGDPNRRYDNVGGSLSLAWSSTETDSTKSVAWGDWDGDGDLDLAMGNAGDPNRVYENEGGRLSLAWSSAETDWTESVAWGDWDGDDELDLAAGNNGQPNRVYENVGDSLSLAWSSPETDDTTSVAWGDWNGDGDLDLAVGNDSQPNRVYENGGGSLSLAWSSTETDSTKSVAWGDWDGDGDLDLAVGNDSQPNRVYESVGGSLLLVWSSPETDNTRSVAWGDWDDDGDLDLAVGNHGQTNRMYENGGGKLSLAWSSAETDDTTSVAWGDWDDDGDLDLAVGNLPGSNCQPNRVYENVGGSLTLAWSSPQWDSTSSVAWGDWDGDGDLDLAVGNHSQPNRVYENGGGSLTLAWSSTETEITHSVACGDWDGDGDLDLAVGNHSSSNRVHLNHSMDAPTLVDSPSGIQITHPGGAAAPFFSSAMVLEGPTLPITYTLIDPEGDWARFVKAYYSLDGGNIWQPAVAASGTITGNLATSPTGTTHTYTWDIYGSGVFGASDSTAFRLDVYQGFGGPGPYMYPFRRAQTLPFRVRGSQVRVLSDTNPVSGAVVYRQPAGQTYLHEPYLDDFGWPFETNSVGYLQGWGEIGVGDKLVALLPITYTEGYTLYHTSAAPSETGLDAHIVTALGVQTLTVSADNPLLLFNLDVSLEWDARNDRLFLDQLEYDLRRASEFLYDWTDGQAALGRVTVYHDREHWNDAHVRIYASNRLRPSAVKGGLVSTVITDPLTTTLTYVPGQVRMGATWNRYGDPGGSLGEDWPRTLAHELGHFALFLDDNYLGLDDEGFLIPVEGCSGAMTDPYRDDDPYGEFHADDLSWGETCTQTLSHHSTGRADWATITALYPWLDGAHANPGPAMQPLAITQVEFRTSLTSPLPLEVPIFTLVQGGERVVPGADARVVLFQDEWLTDLGRPTLDRVLARGARTGDRLCVYEPAAERLGCETITAGGQQLDLFAAPGWQPELVVTPVTSQTVTLLVSNAPPGLSLQARVYPANQAASAAIDLAEAGEGYSGAFELVDPTFEGYVQVWVEEGEDRRETVTGYALGGNPGHKWSHFAPRGSPGHKWSHFAPVISSDGQMMLYGEALEFEEGEYISVQAAGTLPSVPPWTTVVGQGYRLSVTPGAPDLSETSVSFGYLGEEVPPGEEGWLRVYFWDGAEWQPLPTELNLYHNVASARAQGPGLYALMSSLEIPLYGPGWDLFAYPVQVTRPVTEALESIEGYYATVYGFDGLDTSDPWKVYDVSVPSWVNDLHALEFGEGYWISVTQAITLYLKGASDSVQSAELAMQTPPATYYGSVLPGPGLSPTPGMEVIAWIDGHLCGRSETMTVDDQVVYSINVFAEGPGGQTGCGAPGRIVSFYVESQLMRPTVVWNNGRVWELTLEPTSQERIYLPLLLKDH